MNPVVRTAVASVGIGQVGRLEEEVVQAGREDPARLVVGFDLDAAQDFVPLRAGGVPHAGKVPTGLLGLEIGVGAGNADGGEGDLGLQHAIGPEVKGQRITRRPVTRPRGQLHGPDRGTIKPQGKEILSSHPVGRGGAARDRGGVFHPDVAREDQRLVGIEAQAMLAVHEHRGLAAGKSVAMERDARRTRELDLHAVVEGHRVVTGRALFRGLVIAAVGFFRDCPGGGQEQYITQFRETRAAQAGLGKADKARVPVLIAAGVVPAGVAVIRSRLHQAEGHTGPGEGVTRAVSAAEHVDERCVIRSGRAHQRTGESEEYGEQAHGGKHQLPGESE